MSSAERPDELLQGTVEVVTFANPESGFAVLKMAPERGYGDPEPAQLLPASRVVAVGRLERPHEGQRLRLEGRWTTHGTHGRRFEFHAAQLLTVLDPAGLVRYLASGAFAGVGEVLAQRIVDKLGHRALDAIRGDPGALAGIKGLRGEVQSGLARAVADEFDRHERQAFLRGVGLSAAQARTIVERFGPASTELVRRDPYALAEEIPGVGFATADRIAVELGLPADSEERCRAGLLHVLQGAAGDGHVFAPRARLIELARELLRGPDAERIGAALAALADARRVVVEPDGDDAAVYLAVLHAAERELAARLAHLLSARDVPALADARALEQAERDGGLALDPDQRAAVLGLLRECVGLLTGGPGVGKTTIVRLLVELAERAGARVLLASPTGRAARRLSEATGRPASTLHRALAFDPRTGSFGFGPERPLEADLVVVDELSMLDVQLADRLASALAPPTRAVLVGDPDQLPSVGPGNVLHDLIRSGRIPVFRLSRIWRQKSGGRIVENAHRILHGELPELPERGDLASDFYFFPAEEAAESADLLVDVVTERIPKSFGLDWQRDVQVLAPMYRGECGVDALNERLRERLHGPRPADLFGESVARAWRVGDRVIQTRNDYDRDVFNGDMGRVGSIETDGSLAVDFGDRRVRYGGEERNDLQLAFAITVHRAQGSEYPAVVMPLVAQHALMLQRNLLYTAVTRAKRLFVLVGSRRALALAVGNARAASRNSHLAERLRSLLSD